MRKKIISLTVILLFAAVSAFAGTIELPKTGQTTCWDTNGYVISCSGTGQDGDLQMGESWPSPRFIDHGDGTVTDNLTGLMWTKNANLPGGDITWDQAMDYVAGMNNGSGTYGYTDWRLPNVNELESLVNSEVPISAFWLNTQGFTNVQSYCYWSSTTCARYTDYYKDYAWIVSMDIDNLDDVDKSDSLPNGYVWPVRSGQSGTVQLPKTGQTTCWNTNGYVISCSGTGQDGDLQMGESWPSPRFIDHGDGTVTDNLTGLMWTKNADLPYGTEIWTWQEALNYVKTVNPGGYTDWRLPNRKELLSLCAYSQYDDPALPAGHPFTNVHSDWYWSSTTYASRTDSAWIVDMDVCRVQNEYKSYYYGTYVWPVRSGQSGSFENSTTTTASSSGDTTTTTTMEVTTTTTADTGICPVEQALGSKNVDALITIRKFRDKRMGSSAEGITFITLYYKHSDEITRILSDRTALLNKSRKLLFDLLPVLTKCLTQDQHITLSEAQKGVISSLLKSISKEASPSLQKSISFILEHLETGELLKGL